WGLIARILHWATGAVIIFMMGLGVYMTQFVTDIYEQFGLFQTHKSWGFVAFALGALRLIWRAVNTTPELPDGMKSWEVRASQLSHLSLYVLMIAMPVSGWLMASASPLQDSYGIKNMVFASFEYPDPFVPGSQDLETLFSTIHTACAIAIGCIVLVHIAAALKHQFHAKDGLLRRMIVGS
ncbi:MAG: cytochrome b, partial [Pseudomonadota bacterium]